MSGSSNKAGSWSDVRLGALLVSRSSRGGQHLPLLSVVRERGVIPRDVASKKANHNFIPDDLSNYKVVDAGQLVINKMKAWSGSLGIANQAGIVSPAYFVYDVAIENKRYAHLLLRSRTFVDEFARCSGGVRVGQWDLNIPAMKGIRVRVPSVQEQGLIVRYLDHAELRIAKAIAAKQQLLQLLRERRQSIVESTVLKGLVPTLDFKDSGVSWLGSVPSHWRVVRARECFVERVEKSMDGSEVLLSVSHYFGVKPTRQVRKPDSPVLSRAATLVGYKVAMRGDLVVNTMLAWNGSMGASPADGIVSPAYAVYRPLDGVDPKYFQYLLTTPLLKGVIRAWSSGIQDSRLRLYPNKFFQIAVPLPPFDEQLEISTYLDAQLKGSDDAASAITEEITLLKEYRTRLISDVVTGKLDVREEAAKLPEIVLMELAAVSIGENDDDGENGDDD